MQRTSDFNKKIAFELEHFRIGFGKLVFELLQLFGRIAVAVYERTAHDKVWRNRRKLSLAHFDKIAERIRVFYFQIGDPRVPPLFFFVAGKYFVEIVVNASPVIEFFRPADFNNFPFGKSRRRIVVYRIFNNFDDALRT